MINAIRVVSFPKLAYNPDVTFGFDYVMVLINLVDILPFLLRRVIKKSKFRYFNFSICVIG